MTFKSVAEFLDEANGFSPTTAERRLIEATQSGLGCSIGSVSKPTSPTAASGATTIRASLLRLLILGGSGNCGLHERGVVLRGAWIEGELDFAFCKANGKTTLDYCHFTDAPDFQQSAFQQLTLSYCKFPGLFAQGVQITGGLFLRNVTSTKTVDINTAKIGGHLTCDGAKFDGDGKTALNAQGIEVGHSVTFNDVTAIGSVMVNSAKINGQFACGNAHFDGNGNWALFAQFMRVSQGFFFRNVASIKGEIDLSSAHIGDLVDDISSWPSSPESLLLDGFTYDRIAGDAPATFAARRQWLETGSLWLGNFRPQPYTHFARVLRQMGHEAEARKALIERDTQLAAHRFAADREDYRQALTGDTADKSDAGRIWLRMKAAQLWSGLTHRVAGYGYAPQYALYWSLLCIGVSFVVYMAFWRFGAMVPSDAVILTSAEWKAAFDTNPLAPALVWADAARSGPATSHYETFYSLAYAFDVFAPIVDFGQQSTWSATTVTWVGWFARVYTWALQAAGYIVTTLGIAAATGVIQRNQPD